MWSRPIGRTRSAEVDRRALEKIERAIQGIMQAIEDGMYQPSMKVRMEELERQKAEITARLTEAPANAPDVHPNVAEIYRAQVARLTDALASPETHAEAAADVRSLIGEVVITPGAGRGELALGIPPGLLTRAGGALSSMFSGHGTEADKDEIKKDAEEVRRGAAALIKPAEKRTPPQQIAAFRKEFGELLEGLLKPAPIRELGFHSISRLASFEESMGGPQ